MKNNLRAWGVAMASCLLLLAAAQAAKTEAPKLAPQLTYRSAFADHKPYRDVSLASENTAEMPEVVRASPPQADANTLQIRKPIGHEGH